MEELERISLPERATDRFGSLELLDDGHPPANADSWIHALPKTALAMRGWSDTAVAAFGLSCVAACSAVRGDSYSVVSVAVVVGVIVLASPVVRRRSRPEVERHGEGEQNGQGPPPSSGQ